MDLTVWRVNENKCPRCGDKGIYWNSKREFINVFGMKMVKSIATYQCLNDSHEQELFAIIAQREATPFDLTRL